METVETVTNIFGGLQNHCFPGGSEVKASAWNVEDPGSIPGSGRSPGGGNGTPLQYSCLENFMDREAWWATVHGVTESRTQLSNTPPKSLQMVTSAMKLKDTYSLEKAMAILDSILKSRDVTLPTRFRLVEAVVFPVVVYGCGSWTAGKAKH